MNKLTVLSILSKIFAHTTWAVSNVYRTVKHVSKQAVYSFDRKSRYDVEIFKGNEQIDKKEKITHQQLIDVVNTLSVFPSLSLIVYKSDKKSKPIVIDL